MVQKQFCTFPLALTLSLNRLTRLLACELGAIINDIKGEGGSQTLRKHSWCVVISKRQADNLVQGRHKRIMSRQLSLLASAGWLRQVGIASGRAAPGVMVWLSYLLNIYHGGPLYVIYQQKFVLLPWTSLEKSPMQNWRHCTAYTVL